MSETIHPMLLGAVAMAGVVIALQFLKFWRLSKDRFFIFFALAFLAFVVGFTIRAIAPTDHDYTVYLPRLIGFLIILFAIYDKNRRA